MHISFGGGGERGAVPRELRHKVAPAKASSSQSCCLLLLILATNRRVLHQSVLPVAYGEGLVGISGRGDPCGAGAVRLGRGWEPKLLRGASLEVCGRVRAAAWLAACMHGRRPTSLVLDPPAATCPALFRRVRGR